MRCVAVAGRYAWTWPEEVSGGRRKSNVPAVETKLNVKGLTLGPRIDCCPRLGLQEGVKRMKKLVIAAALASFAAAPVLAQNTAQGGLVNVNVSNVLNDLDLDLLNSSLNNNTVQVPIGVAANVCGVDANVLAKQRKADSPVTCTARNTSQALKQAAKRQAVPKT